MGTEVRLRADTNAPAEARRLIRSVPGLPVRLYEDAGLLVSELVTNSIVLTSPGPNAPIGLRVTLDGRTLRVEVSDSSPERATRREATAAGGGFGLNIVGAFADRWGTEMTKDGHHVVWFEMHL
jgi:anti-sigma regulatory factor (Ser/Thr protein kinase)